MSELKAYIAPTPDGTGLADYYLKPEVDKVIAELKADYKEACGRLQTANLIKDEQLAATRHQKYKRCLAMVMYCHESAMWLEENGVNKYAAFMLRWEKIWLELSKKFKEAK